MNSKLLVIGVGIILFVGGVLFIVSNSQQNISTNFTSTIVDEKSGVQQNNGRYVTYSPDVFEAATDKKRVYYFHAPWCPTCKVANAEFESNKDKIPAGVILFKTDYDSNADLKKRYGITYQHTFVQVDREGNEIAKWNGGGIAELVANIR